MNISKQSSMMYISPSPRKGFWDLYQQPSNSSTPSPPIQRRRKSHVLLASPSSPIDCSFPFEVTKKTSRSFLFDRFIKFHDNKDNPTLDLDDASVTIIKTQEHDSQEPNTHTVNGTSSSNLYKKQLAKICNGTSETSSSTTPIAPYYRQMPCSATRVLDAPGIANEKYMKVIDWSIRNQICVSLGSCLYTWAADNGEVNLVCDLEELEQKDYISSVQFSSDGFHVATGGYKGQTVIYDTECAQLVRVFKSQSATLDQNVQKRAMSLNWRQYLIAIGNECGDIEVQDGRCKDSLVAAWHDGHSGQAVLDLKWHVDGKTIASSGDDKRVKIWDMRMATRTRSGQKRKLSCSMQWDIDFHHAAVQSLAWNPCNSSLLVSGAHDGQICLWNTSSRKLVCSQETKKPVISLAWSSLHRELCSSHDDSMDYQSKNKGSNLCLWKYAENNTLSTFKLTAMTELTGVHSGRLLDMTRSPNEQFIATVGTDENLKLWKVWEMNKTQIKKIKKKSAAVVDTVASPQFLGKFAKMNVR